jgi:hypothetical protein
VELLARLHHGPTASPSPGEVASRPFSVRVRGALIRWRWWLGLAAALLLVLAGFLVWRPDLPPRTGLGTIVGLLDEGRLRNLDLRDTTLTVVEDNGDRLRVEGVSAAEFDPIFQEALARGAQGVTAGGDGNYLGQLVAALGVMVLPPVALLLFVILMVRIVRRPSSLGS